jgi:hypothetical protein
VKEHLLADSDRAALQSLVPLASVLGVSTMFALFFGSRKRTACAVLEIVAIVGVLAAVALTAATAIALLHRNQAISDQELTETAMPLVVAACLLIYVTAIARLGATGEGGWSMLPVGFVFLWERYSARWSSRREVAVLISRLAGGYLPDRKSLLLALPGTEYGPPPRFQCWVRRGRTYLDLETCRQLRELTAARWDAVAEGSAQPPAGSRILAAVALRYRFPFRRGGTEALIATVSGPGGEAEARALAADVDGLVDVTDLGLL